jgi:hypothetical protein
MVDTGTVKVDIENAINPAYVGNALKARFFTVPIEV